MFLQRPLVLPDQLSALPRACLGCEASRAAVKLCRDRTGCIRTSTFCSSVLSSAFSTQHTLRYVLQSEATCIGSPAVAEPRHASQRFSPACRPDCPRQILIICDILSMSLECVKSIASLARRSAVPPTRQVLEQSPYARDYRALLNLTYHNRSLSVFPHSLNDPARAQQFRSAVMQAEKLAAFLVIRSHSRAHENFRAATVSAPSPCRWAVQQSFCRPLISADIAWAAPRTLGPASPTRLSASRQPQWAA